MAAPRGKSQKPASFGQSNADKIRKSAAAAGLSLAEVKRALNAGKKHAERNEWPEAVKELLIAWDAFPEDLNILTVLAHALTQLGVREHAIYVLERALQHHKPTPDVCSVIQQLALEMGFNEIAEKLGHQLIAMEPSVAKHYINVMTALNRQDKYTEAIDIAQQVLPMFPDSSDLWNVLASSVRFRDGNAASVVFYEEALRLDPDNYKALSNLSAALQGSDRAVELTTHALKLQPENPELHINMALELFRRGKLLEGWHHYAYRLDSRRAQSQNLTYTHKIPEWDGSPLKGKTLLVAAEQGVGDEVMFGNYLPFLYDEAEKLYIGVDPRLVSLFQRRFPDAMVMPYMDRMKEGYRYRIFLELEREMEAGNLEIDYAIPIGSASRFAWKNTEDVLPHPDGFLQPDPERLAEFGERLAHLKDKPIVGLAWRTGMSGGARKHFCATVEDLAPLKAIKDKVHFVNLMYSDVTEDLKQIKDQHGIEITHLDGVNLKADIEANIAIMAHCDVVLSACSAPGMFALSSGRPTVLFTEGSAWWCFGTKDSIPFAANAEVENGYEQSTFLELVERATARVQKKLGL
ncbi:tetratricopeptide repeat protein [Kordiimonas gwangyangensis]|uniref:tetratricopeptide repeat protein n=1 Tax=Kordiimonas gwangyangensis TaxID=288022 RepID=UPI0012DE39B4|nr:hypothetical protein [Kordiimonas gwangyangensis]